MKMPWQIQRVPERPKQTSFPRQNIGHKDVKDTARLQPLSHSLKNSTGIMQVFQHVVARDRIEGVWRKLHIDDVTRHDLAAGVSASPLRCFCALLKGRYI